MNTHCKRLLSVGLLLQLLSLPAFLTGCVNPLSMGFATPIPVPPWVPDRIQDRFEGKNDHRVPVLPPIPPGYRPYCEDPPGQREILRAMPQVTRGVPYVYEEFRDDIEFTVEKIVDKIDPPRFYSAHGAGAVASLSLEVHGVLYGNHRLLVSFPVPRAASAG